MSDTDNTQQPTDQPATPPTAAPVANPADADTGGNPTPAASPAEGGQDPSTTSPPRQRPWYQTRIDQLTAQRRQAETRAQQLEAQLSQYRGVQPAVTPPTAAQPAPAPQPTTGQAPAANPSYTYSDHDAINQRAQELLQRQQFDARCNEVAELGKTSFPDFQQTMENFNMLGGLGQHMGLLEAATTMDNAHEILYHLGKDLNQAMRISSLPPVQQGIEMARLSTQLRQRAGAQVSNAPAPINPITGTASNPVPTPDANGEFKNQDEFRRFREAQRAAKKNKR